MGSSILYQYASNNNSSARMNARISGKKSSTGGELDSAYAELLADSGSNPSTALSNGILSLSINDPKPRTPMDLIQV